MEAGIEEVSTLESAAFASWPALEGEEDQLGWRLRYGGGYTKRANSANSGAGAAALSDEQIDGIARRYRQRGLTPIFRLVSATAPAATDAALERQGYRYVDRSLVLSLPLTAAHAGDPPGLVEDAGEWLAAFTRASGGSATQHDVHLAMLRRIEGRCAFAVERRDGEPVCFALGVLVDGRLGLFDVLTPEQHRRQGLAAELCSRLLAWGRAQGAHSAYLQVVAANAPAITLYEKLGFREAYHYWYRVAP